MMNVIRMKCLLSLAVLYLITIQACSGDGSSEQPRPRIAATIFPLCDIARNISGDKLEVIEILPPGASPHTYDLTPQQARRLQGVALVFSIGHGLDDWTSAVVEILPDARRVTVDKGIELKASDDEADEGEHENHHEDDGVNPHYWLSVENAKAIARAIAEEVIALDAENEEYYTDNLTDYLAQLDDLKKEIESRLSGLRNRKMITFHDSWLYYADEFGLRVVASFEPFPGKQPTPRYLATLQKKAQEHNIRCLFSEPQLSTESVKQFVADMGLKLYVLDPLGGVGERQSYIDLMRYNTNVIAEALADE